MVGANWNLLLHIRGKGAMRFGPINLSDLAEQVSYRVVSWSNGSLAWIVPWPDQANCSVVLSISWGVSVG